MTKTLVHLITSLEGGGTEIFLWHLLKYAPKNLAQRVFYLKKDGVIGERIRALNIPVQKVDSRLLWQELRKNTPDVLHTCLYRAHQLGRVFGRMAGIKRIVSSQRAIDSWQKPWHVYVDAFTLPFCDDVVVNSSAAEKLVRGRIGPRATPRITKILNGVDLQRFMPGDRIAARRVLGLPEEAPIGGSLMRLHAEKGADYIVPFAEKIFALNPSLHLVVGGVGPMEMRLKQQTQNKPWSHRLHWAGWIENTPVFYAALDFFWLLSREESFPQSLLEASVMGIPWIAPEIGGVPDLISAGAPGQTYRAKDIRQAADLALNISQNQLLRTPFNRETFSLNFAIEKKVAQFYDGISL